MEILDFVGIAHLKDMPAEQLSYGQKKLLEFAFILIAVTDDIEGTRAHALLAAPMHQRVFLAMGDPDFRGARGDNSGGKTGPVRVIGDDKRQCN